MVRSPNVLSSQQNCFGTHNKNSAKARRRQSRSIKWALAIPVNGDTQSEPNETFFVNLSNAINASISKAQGVGTIVNDDGVAPVPCNSVSRVTTCKRTLRR